MSIVKSVMHALGAVIVEVTSNVPPIFALSFTHNSCMITLSSNVDGPPTVRFAVMSVFPETVRFCPIVVSKVEHSSFAVNFPNTSTSSVSVTPAFTVKLPFRIVELFTNTAPLATTVPSRVVSPHTVKSLFTFKSPMMLALSLMHNSPTVSLLVTIALALARRSPSITTSPTFTVKLPPNISASPVTHNVSTNNFPLTSTSLLTVTIPLAIMLSVVVIPVTSKFPPIFVSSVVVVPLTSKSPQILVFSSTIRLPPTFVSPTIIASLFTHKS